MENAKISVIIPVYNGEKYLGRCLDSFERQTFKDFEVIIVDDGSSDETERVIESYLSKSLLHIRNFYQDNSGQAAARNNGLLQAVGKYVAFVDSDDYVDEHYLEALYHAAVSCRSDVVVCGYRQVDEDGKELRHVVLTQKKSELYGPAGMFVVWSKLFSREFLTRHNFRFQEGGKIFEDVPYTISTKYLAEHPVAIKYSGYYYVMRKGSTMNSGTVKSSRFPYEKMTEAIKQAVEFSSGEAAERLEFEILHFFTGFLFRYCRKADPGDIRRITNYCKVLLGNYFPKYYKNCFLSLRKNREQTLLELLAIKTFVVMNRCGLIDLFSVMITRI